MAVQTNTRKADKIVAGKALVEKIKDNLQKVNADRLLADFKEMQTKVLGIYGDSQGKWHKIENKPFYYYTEGFYIVDPSRFLCGNSGDVATKVDGVPATYMNWEQFSKIYNNHRTCPVYSGYDGQYRKIKDKDGTEYRFFLGYYPNGYRDFYIYNNGNSYSYSNDWSSQSSVNSDVMRLPVSNKTGFKNAVTYNIMPADLTEYEKKVFQLAVDYQSKGWLVWDGNNIENLSYKFYTALKADSVEDFEDMLFKSDSIDKYIKDGKELHMDFSENFVNVDKVRINLTPYEETRLTDPNGGHWDLWSEKAGENEVLVKLSASYYGRNPVADVKPDGIVGIDFGTKSTVVTFQNGTDTIAPMRIGCGDYTKDVAASDYENPTVIEFIDLDAFMNRYNASAYRPLTEWNDLTISHTAADSLNTPQSSNEYYAWFSDLKQWASDKNRKIIIRDKQGKEVELSPFTDISSGELNPIELYAYMLGLFINNMYNGIYINYILSFPVTYERKVRRKIAAAFENGLKKSLPKPVQEDDNVMGLFRVIEGASEPAAYAVCALQEYGFAPQEDEKILYGIFDFGGGTTDFDFGTWQRAPKKLRRRYDYVIKHFGAGGDRLLGGENLLELLAYSVFKANEATLRKEEIQFTKPSDADRYCGMFEGSEVLISDSQQAKINHRQLAEELRPLWHGEEYSKDSVKLNLYNTKGEVKTPELNVDVAALKELIRRRIDSGVENFFEAMDTAITDEIAEDVNKIHIFLAGNSSKSKVLRESFEYFRKKYEPVFMRKFGIEAPEIKTEKSRPDYLVKKYADQWGKICSYCYKEYKVAVDENAEDDLFIKELSAKDFNSLFWSITSAIMGFDEDSYQERRKDFYELWSEGVVTIDSMTATIDFYIENDNGYKYFHKYIIDFIYSHAETPEELKNKIKSKWSDVEFDDDIAEKTSAKLKEIQKKHDEERAREIFTLYPSLGTAESDEMRKQMGLTVSSSVTRPTGKTGVAYGLIECRAGSRIKVESEINETDEIKFNFYTGYASLGKFEVVTDRDIEYGKWIEFIDAGEADFELYYTDLPEAVGNQMSINGVAKKNCRIDEVMEDAMVYIRAVEPSVMEYCAAFGEDELKKQDYLSPPKKIVLE